VQFPTGVSCPLGIISLLSVANGRYDRLKRKSAAGRSRWIEIGNEATVTAPDNRPRGIAASSLAEPFVVKKNSRHADAV
jgi:hypothetical protein